MSVSSAKKKSLKIPTQHRHQICCFELFPFRCLSVWILNTSHFKHGLPNASSFTLIPVWTVQEEEMSIYLEECCWGARWSALLKRPYLLTLWRFSSEHCYKALLFPSGWIFRKKEKNQRFEGSCKPTAHVRNNSKIYSKGQTTYQKSSWSPIPTLLVALIRGGGRARVTEHVQAPRLLRVRSES